MARDAVEDLRAELGIAELQGREVDGEHQVRGRHLPAGKLGTAELQHQLAELADEPQLLRQRDELVGETMPNSGWGQRQSSSAPCSRLLWVQMMGW